jgi:hypothetical protein
MNDNAVQHLCLIYLFAVAHYHCNHHTHHVHIDVTMVCILLVMYTLSNATKGCDTVTVNMLTSLELPFLANYFLALSVAFFVVCLLMVCYVSHITDACFSPTSIFNTFVFPVCHMLGNCPAACACVLMFMCW